VTLVLDAGPVIAAHDRHDSRRGAAAQLLREEPGDLVLPAPVTAEIDYLVRERLGSRSRRGFLADLAAGRYRVECLEPEEYATVLELEDRYADHDPGLADLSIVVLAHRFGTTRVATFDERHFRAMQPLGGGSFTILPADE
jgi:predicted nucleic acid-binding protein